MVSHPRRRRPVVIGAVLTLSLLLPALAAGGAQAAPATKARSGANPVRPAAAPSSDVLLTLSDLLARLLSSPAPFGGVPGASSRIAASTVRVSGVACGVRLIGSGFSPAPDTIVTNAHVVAGVTNPVVQRPDGTTLAARVQVFDPNRDLAVLSVPGLGQSPLPLASAVVGETAAVFGHPGGLAAVEVSPARVVRRVTADVGNIYDTAPFVRRILVLNAQIDPGDSGAALVNGSGQVIGVTFAMSVLRRSTAFAIASEDLQPVLARPRGPAVATGPCLAA